MGKGMILACVMRALIAAYVITGILLLGLAFALYKFQLSENTINLGIIVIYVFSSFIGGFSVGRMIKEKKFLWGLVIGVLYISIIILASSLAVGHMQIIEHQVGTAALLSIGGGMLGGMFS